MPPINSASPTPPPPSKKRLSLTLDIRLILIIVLLAAIGAMLLLWRPWEANVKATDRTITVTGDATLMATPDQYAFSPSYDFQSTDKQTALNDMSQKSDDLITKLKALGVADKDIQTNSSGYATGIYLPVDNSDGTTTYTLSLTITVTDKTLAQKVQDYLVTTSPTGDISPVATFSDAKTKSLQSEARDQATQDARSKADQSAKNLGFKVAAVKSVNDGSGFGNPIPVCGGGGSLLCAGAESSGSSLSAQPSLAVQPGQNQLSYSVTVVYYIK